MLQSPMSSLSKNQVPSLSNNTEELTTSYSKKKPAKKYYKLIIGSIAFLLIILGSFVGVYLTQYSRQDLRQQAFEITRCDDTCLQDEECSSALGEDFFCRKQANQNVGRCRRVSNPTSMYCHVISCGTVCDSDEVCKNSLGDDYFCYSRPGYVSGCRLTSNPTSTTCQEAFSGYECNSDCTTTIQCKDSLGDGYFCYSGKCRLESNRTSTTCATSWECNGACTLSSECVQSLGDGYTCTSGRCRLISNTISPTCSEKVCGNGLLEVGEICDDGNEVDTDACRNNCTVPSCGDGIVDGNEACDDGNEVDTDACRNNCTVPSCGDGIVDGNEACDDGNTTNEDGCSNLCQVEDSVEEGGDSGEEETLVGDSSDSESTYQLASIGCNEICTTDADCAVDSYVCATTQDGTSRCRLAENLVSTSCVSASTDYTQETQLGTVASPTVSQPILPETLPVTGVGDYLNWIKAGAVSVVLGTLLFLML